MDPIRSSLGGGLAATAALFVFLLIADFLFGGADLFVFTTFVSLCAVGGPPYCDLGTPIAALATYLWFGVLFAVAWPLFFVAFTWGLPGESGPAHGAAFGLFLWTGYAVVVVFLDFGGKAVAAELSLLGVTLLAYLVYGLVLGGGYDHLAEHRELLGGRATT